MQDNLLNKLNLLQSLQQEEISIYQRFFIKQENKVHILVKDFDQANILNDIMVEKKKLMDDINALEFELSPLRKEIANLSEKGDLGLINNELLQKVKSNDLLIIELISRISEEEQKLTKKMKEHLEILKERLGEINNQKRMNKAYGAYSNNKNFNANGLNKLDING